MPARGPLASGSLKESIKSMAAVVLDGTHGGIGVMHGLQKKRGVLLVTCETDIFGEQ